MLKQKRQPRWPDFHYIVHSLVVYLYSAGAAGVLWMLFVIVFGILHYFLVV
jgi:hypothetical protein